MYKKIELFYEPENILEYMEEGYCEMSSSEHAFLCGLIKKYQPKKIVEIGVAGGGTTAVIMNCLNLLGSDAKMFSVDISEKCYRREKKQTGYQLEEVKSYLPNYDNHKFLLGKFLPEIIEQIGRDIDFVILDTVHSLPGELLDFLCIVPFLTNNVPVVMHDIVLNVVASKKTSFATKIVMDAAIGEKYYNYEDDILNIGAVIVGEETRSNIANLFSSFSISWEYMPSDYEMELYRNIYCQYYSEECIKIFSIFTRMQTNRLKGIKTKDFSFVDVGVLSNIILKDEYEKEKMNLYQRFLETNQEVIYIVEQSKKLCGVISIGDICRWYKNNCRRDLLNENYRFCNCVDFQMAKELFTQIKAMHEIPVIEQGEFIGTIMNGGQKSSHEWKKLREDLVLARKRYLKQHDGKCDNE